MTAFVPEFDDVSFSVVGSNVSNVASFSSTLAQAYIQFYPSENSNTGFFIGASNTAFAITRVESILPALSVLSDDTVYIRKALYASNLAPSATIDTTNATNITSGTLAATRLPTSGVTSGFYGTASAFPAVEVDTYGRVTRIATCNIVISSSSITGLAASATTDTTNATNITSGTLSATRLPASGASAGFYGTASAVPAVEVDTYGRITKVATCNIVIAATSVTGLAASATTDTTNATNISSGTFASGRLPTSGVVAGTVYGNASTVPSLDIDIYGRITKVASCNITIAANSVTGLAASATTDTTNATNITSGTLASARLPTSGATAGFYGTVSTHPAIEVDTYGRITKIATCNIAIASTSVTGLAASATTDTTNATNITSGTLSSGRLPTSGVTAGFYGTVSTVVAVELDTYGRVIKVANCNITIPAASVTGLATVATTGNYNDLSNRTFVLNGAAAYYNGGNVGVGVTSPAYKLHVDGDVYANGTLRASNLSIIGDTVIMNTITSNTEQMTISNDGTGPALIVKQTGPQPIVDIYDDSTLALRVADGALVGITTATPQARLHVHSTGAGDAFRVLNNFVVNSVGNLGVGTLTPLYPLHVIGALAATSITSTTQIDATSITSGTLTAARLPASGATAGFYGNATTVAAVEVDTYGRITKVTNCNISFSATNISGLAASATTDTTNATNITSGTLASARLPTSGVTAGFYGTASTVAAVQVDTYGRITKVAMCNIVIASSAVTGLAASATTDTTNATNISSGTLNSARLPTSGVTAGFYGTVSVLPAIDVDTYGRITKVATCNIAIAATAVSGLAASATTDTTNATNISSGTLASVRLPTSGVAAGSYGTASTHGAFDVDTYGRITKVAMCNILIPYTAVTGLAASATTDTTNATNITSGTLASGRLPTSGVTAGFYGTTSTHAALDVDTYGRITKVAMCNIAIAATAVSGLAASATTDTTNATNITSGTLASGRLPTSGVASGFYGTASTHAALDVDTYGRITKVAMCNIVIPAASVTGLATVATTGNYNDLSNRTFVLNGAAAYYNGGNVGVGVTSPAYKLHVDGDIYANGTLRASNLAITGDTVIMNTITSNTEQMTISNDGTGPALIVKQTGAQPIVDIYDDSTLAVRIADGALVGITTATPQARLHVNSTGTGDAFRVLNNFVVNSVGNLGVGTLTPLYPLHVIGAFAATSITSTTQIDAASITSGTLASGRLPTSGVTAGSYGTVSTLPAIDVDTYGRITKVATCNISITATSVSGLAASATTDTTNATNITSGTLSSGRLPASGVTAGSYGTASTHGAFDVDTYGRITKVAMCNIVIPSTAVTGLAASATTDTTNATNISSGTLASARLPTSGVVAGTVYGTASTIASLDIDTYGRITKVATCNIVIAATSVTGLAASATTDTTNATNISSGTLNSARLPTSGVVAGTVYGTASTVPSLNIDTYGRITKVATCNIAIAAAAVSGLAASATTDTTNATNISSGTLAAVRLATSGVAAGYYGTASTHGAFDVDTYGRITKVAMCNIVIASSAVTGLVASATTDTTNATNISSGTLNAARLPTSGVTSGFYGTATTIAAVEVDTYGRITKVATCNISITASSISGLAASATTDTTNATNITSGTLNASRLATSGVVAGSYGTVSTHPALDIDTYGRITKVAMCNITIAATSVTGLAASATTDATNATNISSGTLNAARLPTSGVAAGSYGTVSTHPALEVDTYGRITKVAMCNITIAAASVTGLAASATTDTTNATNISSGTLNAARLPTSGVGAGTYGTATTVPSLTVDTYGRVTSVSATTITIPAANVTGLATVATTGNYNDLSNRTFVLNGTSAYYANGNVGVGVTTPVYKLHVEGDVYANGTLRTSNLVVLGDTVTMNTVTSNTEQMTITNDGTGPALIVKQTGAQPIVDIYDDSTLAVRVADGGNVGIGTNIPLAKLHVYQLGLDDAFRVDDIANDSTPFLINSLGYVGINTTAANAHLHVNGSALADNLRFRRTLDNSFNYHYIGTDANHNFSIESTGTDKYTVFTSSTADGIRNVFTIGGTTSKVAVNGNTSFQCDNAKFLVDSASSNVGIGTLTPFQRLHVVGASYFTSNVGIGTSTPTHALHVYSGSTTNNDYESTALLLENATAGEAAIVLRNSNVNAGGNIWFMGLNSNSTRLDIGYGAQASQLADASVDMCIDTVGNVGIGSTLPAQKLHVEGTGYVSTSLGVGLSQPAYAVDVAGYIRSSLGFRVGANEVIDSDGNFVMRNIQVLDGSGNTSLYVSEAGSVGIATDNPVVPLDIQSTIVNFGGNVGMGTTAPVAKLHVSKTDTGDIVRVDDEATETTPFIIKDDGSIGIGTSTPVGKLHIYETSGSYPSAITIDGSGGRLSALHLTSTYNGIYWAIANRPSDNNNLYIASSIAGNVNTFTGTSYTNAAKVTIKQDGNVGIGTTSPTHKLHLYSTSTTDNDYESAGILLENTTPGETAIAFRNSNVSAGGNIWFMGLNSNSTRLDIGYGAQTSQLADSSVDMCILSNGNVGIGTTIPQQKLDVYGNISFGNGQNGSASTTVGGSFFKQVSWDAPGLTHTIAFPTYCGGDNSGGTLYIQVTNKLTAGTRKIGTAQYSFIKCHGSDIDVFENVYHRNTNLANFSVAVSGTDIVVTTDSDCSIAWTSIGSY